MKLKLFEIAFLATCIICITIGIMLSVSVRGDVSVEKLDITTPDSSDTAYPVDIINRATAEDFMSVSGIGEVKAADIIAFRDAVGGFKRVEQLKDVNGISDALYARIIEHFYGDSVSEPSATDYTVASDKPIVTSIQDDTDLVSAAETGTVTLENEPVSTTESTEHDVKNEMREVNINSASAEEISSALLIDIGLAESIVDIREQINAFSSDTELYLVRGMSDSTYIRIRSYVLFE